MLRRLNLIRHVGFCALVLAVVACQTTAPDQPEATTADASVARELIADEDHDHSAPFDQAEAARLLAEADTIRGDQAAAVELYRQAAWLWPDRIEAWQRLAALAADAEAREAATFVASRVTLYPSNDLFVQREVRRLLENYVEEHAGQAGVNPLKLTYIARLAAFYGHRHDARGRYAPPAPIWAF